MVLVIIGERRTLWMIYYLDLGVNHKYEPEADAVEFCAGKVSDRLCRGSSGYLSVRFRRFQNNWGENFGSCFNRPVVISLSLMV